MGPESGRINKDALFMGVARLLSRRATCPRGQVGAVLVRDGRIISTGYSGSPPGADHCVDVGCEVDESRGGCVRTVHAEANAVAFAARHGVGTSGCILYVTLSPCVDCAKLACAAGVSEVVYGEEYRDVRGIMILSGNGIICRNFKET